MTISIPGKIRSWLFAPGDSTRKMTKATEGDADRIIFDLEDSVVTQNKPDARKLVGEHLASNSDNARLWVRVNPLDGPYTLDDLVAIMPGRPGGIVLPKACGKADLERLNHYVMALEVANGIAPGTTPVLALVTETAEAMFHTGTYKASPRLCAMSWGAEDLSDSLGVGTTTNADGSYAPPFELARSLCLLGAATAAVPAIETIQADFRDLEGLKNRAAAMRRAGFRGMLAIHPAQVPIINAAFTPSKEELAEAREIVSLFAANPAAGTIGWKGGMLDRPHLSRAQQLLRQAGEE